MVEHWERRLSGIGQLILLTPTKQRIWWSAIFEVISRANSVVETELEVEREVGGGGGGGVVVGGAVGREEMVVGVEG